MEPQADPQQPRGHRHDAPALRRHGPDQHDSRQHRRFYKGGGDGIVWALDAATGKPKWKFNTVSDGAKLWGNPKVNSGGGLWYPPAVDSQGRVFISVANPAPLYGTKRFPNGSSRPGPDLYTNSLVALDGQTGKRLWFRQAVRHDVRDYDLEIPAIITTLPIDGVQTDVVLVAGKMGKAYAYRAADGKHLWTRSFGKHQNDTGRLPRKPVTIFPGDYGGVETPMALAANRLFVPWIDFPVRASATGLSGALTSQNFSKGRGGFSAVDAASGKVLWQRKLPSMDFGAATVANDVVFTSTYAGTVYAFDTQTGKTLWTTKAPAGINSFPAIDGDTLLVGAGTTGFHKKPKFRLIAYSTRQGVHRRPPMPSRRRRARRAPPRRPGQREGVLLQALTKSSRGLAGSRSTSERRSLGAQLHGQRQAHADYWAGQDSEGRRQLQEEGKYRYLCTVPGHAAAGMKGVFTVR